MVQSLVLSETSTSLDDGLNLPCHPSSRQLLDVMLW